MIMISDAAKACHCRWQKRQAARFMLVKRGLAKRDAYEMSMCVKSRKGYTKARHGEPLWIS